MFNVNNQNINNTQYNNTSLKSETQSVKTSGENVSSAASKLVKDINNLMAGDSFFGQVSSIKGNQVTLLLPNGGQINASIKNQDTMLGVGQNMTFLVESNDGKTIALKSMQFIDQQTNYIASKALEAANLNETPDNMMLVKELLDQNMAINSQTLNDMVKAMAKNPEANVDTLTRLYKLDIPITKENITQFEAYKSYENSISGEIMDIAKGFGEFFNESVNNNNLNEAANMLDNVINTLYGENIEENAGENLQKLPETIEKFVPKEERDNLLKMMSDISEEKLSPEFKENLAKGNVTAKQVINELSNLLKNSDIPPEKAGKLFESKEFTKLMEMVMRDTMHMSPENMKEKANVKDFYEKVKDNVEKLIKDVEEKAGKETNISKSLNNVKDNLDFMNDLNKNMTYFQMPIKFSENNANGELYVFTNKKRLMQNSDEISALLHLDMDNLGPVDIFVKLKNTNVSTNFCLESEEMLDFVYSHIDELNDRLKALGYDCKFEMTVREEDKPAGIDFVEEFIDMDLSKKGATSQFIFDRKA